MATLLKKSRNTFLLSAAVVAATVTVLVMIAANTKEMQRLENVTYDARVRALDRKFANDPATLEEAKKYIVIDIDNASFDGLKPLLGRWPWSRQVWAEVIRWVNTGNPKLIGVDIVYSGAEDKPGVDTDFARVIERSGKVVLAYNITPGVQIETVDDSQLKQSLEVMAKEARPQTVDAIGEENPLAEVALNVPLAVYGEASAGLGVIRSVQDVDGVVRRAPIQFITGSKVYPSLNLRMAQLAVGSHAPMVRMGRTATDGTLQIPIDENGRLILLWRLRTLKPQRIPMWHIICSMYPTQCPPEAPRVTPDLFKDKLVMLAASAAASFDAHVMPLAQEDEKLPGFIVHMNALENYLNGHAVRETPRWFMPLAILLMAVTGAAILTLLPSALWSVLSAIGLGAAYSGTALYLYERNYIWVPITAPLVALTLSYVGTGLARYATTGRELRQTRGTLNRYVSPQLVQYVLEHIDTINLAGEKKELTILFSDVRNFTTITESSDPMELIATLNEYLAEMTEVVFKYDGITDKFIGDGILAYWGAFTPEQNHAELACRAALEMNERLDRLNAKWKSEGRSPLAIGIGINTGDVVFGNVGSGRKIEFTVIGDAVNLAARLESQTKDFGVKILISEYTVAKAGATIVAPALGGVKVKGKSVDTWVFELQSMAPELDSQAAEEASSGK
jgi:adenylate cyclase